MPIYSDQIFSADGRSDSARLSARGSTKGTTRGPRGPKKKTEYDHPSFVQGKNMVLGDFLFC